MYSPYRQPPSLHQSVSSLSRLIPISNTTLQGKWNAVLQSALHRLLLVWASDQTLLLTPSRVYPLSAAEFQIMLISVFQAACRKSWNCKWTNEHKETGFIPGGGNSIILWVKHLWMYQQAAVFIQTWKCNYGNSFAVSRSKDNKLADLILKGQLPDFFSCDTSHYALGIDWFYAHTHAHQILFPYLLELRFMFNPSRMHAIISIINTILVTHQHT